MAAALVQKILYLVITVLAFIVLGLGAGTVAHGVIVENGVHTYIYYKRDYIAIPPQCIAVLVFGIITWLFFLTATILLFLGKGLPVIADFVVIFCLFVFGLGSCGSFAALFVVYTHISSLSQITAALGFILCFLLLATLIFLLVVVIRNYGFNGPTLRSSLPALEGGEKTLGVGGQPAPVVSVAAPVTGPGYAPMGSSAPNTYAPGAGVAPHTHAAGVSQPAGEYTTPYGQPQQQQYAAAGVSAHPQQVIPQHTAASQLSQHSTGHIQHSQAQPAHPAQPVMYTTNASNV